MKIDHWKQYLGCLFSICLCAALNVYGGAGGFGGGGFPGFGGGGFGGFGGGGGGGGGGGAANRAGGQQQYTPNGQIGQATIAIDNSGNLVVIADRETLEQIQKAVHDLDQPRPQVLIKVAFLEVQHNDSLDIGIEGAWGHTYGTNDPITGIATHAFGVSPLGTIFSPTNLNAVGQQIGNFAPNPPGAGLYQVLGTDFQVTLRAIAQAGKAQLLSRPSILARDRQPATIQVGQRVPLVTSVNVSALGNQNNGVTYTDVGIILRVTPFITPDGMVQMILSPETSALDQSISIPISPGVSAPVINIRYADTVAITPDGQTVVIGGLMATDKAANDSKIPFLGDIPLIGNLFKRQTKAGTKRELLIFLTPHVVRDEVQMAQMSAHEESTHNLIRKSVSEEELDKFLDRLPVKQEKGK